MNLPAEQYREVIEDCHATGKQMSRIVECLLALARLDAGVDRVRTCDVDVAELAEECVDLVRPLAVERQLDLGGDPSEDIIRLAGGAPGRLIGREAWRAAMAQVCWP